MNKNQTSATPLLERELVINRVFDALRELMWTVWTNATQLATWWGPSGFTNPRCEIDVRPGGAIYIDMQGPDGTVYPMSGVFEEISEPEKLVFRSSALDGKGEAMFEVLTTVEFQDVDGKTALTLKAKPTMVTPAAAPHLGGMDQGWNQSLDRLAGILRDAVSKGK